MSLHGILRIKIARLSTVFLLFILQGPSAYLAQVEDTVRVSKWEIGVTYSPDYAYRTLKAEPNDYWMLNSFDTMEVAKYGYTTGLNVVYRINDRIEFSSGVLFSDKGEKTKEYALTPVVNYKNHYYYLDIPFKLSYIFNRKKFFVEKHKKLSFYVVGGASLNVFLKTTSTRIAATSDKTEETSVSNSGISRLNLAFLFGAGVDVPISKKWYFKAEPNYRRSLTPIANAPIRKYLYSFGLNAGLYFRF